MPTGEPTAALGPALTGWRRLLPDGDRAWIWAVAVALLVRLPGLGISSLGVDDGVSLFNAAPPVADIVRSMLAGREVHPPLYFYWLHPFVALAGPESFGLAGGLESWFRWSSLPWSVAVVVLTYAVAARVGGRRVACAASLLVASSAFLAYYSWEVRMYPMQTALLLGAALAFLGLDGRPRVAQGWLAVLVVLSVAAFFTHYLSLFHIAPLGVAILVQAGRERHGRAGRLLAVVAVLAPLAWWAPVMHAQAGSQLMSLRGTPSWPQVVEMLFQCSFGVTWAMPLAGWPELEAAGHAVAPWKWVSLLVVAGAGGGLAALAAPRRWLVIGQSAFPVAAVLLVTWLTPAQIFEYKYFQALVPWLFIALASTVALPTRHGRALGATLVALVLAVNLWACSTWLAAPVYWGPQPWREVLTGVGPRLAPGDQVIVHPSMMMTPVLVYGFYEPRMRPYVFGGRDRQGRPALRVTGVDSATDAQLVEAEGRARRLWLLVTPHHPFVVRQRLLDALLPRWRVAATSETAGFWPANRIRVFLLERRADRETTGPPPAL